MLAQKVFRNDQQKGETNQLIAELNLKFGPREDSDVLTRIEDISIRAGTIKELIGVDLLDDIVVNSFFKLIEKRSQENTQLPRVMSFNTFFFKQAQQPHQPVKSAFALMPP
jgi:Ulp1 family protease